MEMNDVIEDTNEENGNALLDNDTNLSSSALPLAPIIAACMVVLCEVIASNSIYPYINFMMHWMNVPESNQGYYVGLLASSYFFAQFIGSFLWGFLSRNLLRRDVLILGMTGVAISSLLLGFSSDFLSALVARFLCGLFSGNIGLAKTLLAEHSNSSNQARIFSFVGITWGLGSILGPFLGGVLSDPCNQYAIKHSNLAICSFPFFLPNLANCILLSIAILVVSITVPPIPARVHLQEDANYKAKNGKASHRVFLLIFKRNVWVSCVIYALVAFAWSIFEEIFPLWSFVNGFSLMQLGFLQSFGGVIGILFQLIAYPVIVGKLGLLGAIRVGSLLAIHGFLAVSWVLVVFPFSVHQAIWVLGCVCIFIQLGAEILFVSSMSLVANSTNEKNLDLVNYIAQAMAAALRTFGPATGASLFAWCVANGQSVIFNQHFVFNIVAALVLGIFTLSYLYKLKSKN